MPDISYELAKYQDHFINGDDIMVCIIGAKGSSKTFSGKLYAIREITEQNGGQGLIMFNTLQQARDIFAQEFEPMFKELNWNYNFNQNSTVLKVFDTIIHFRSAEPTSLKNIESIAYHWGWADEASFYDPKALETFVSRIRKGKARVRITSMPDEPDHFMYQFVERQVAELGGKMYEIALRDNPDREFADRYEKMLKANYTGAQLERYLSGKRVSLAGLGLFAVSPTMRRADVIYDPDSDLLLSWDFNVEYRAVSAWQQIGHNEQAQPIIGCVRSWQLKNANVYEDAIQLSRELSEHNGAIYLHGDASGENRTASTTYSMWKTVRETMDNNLRNIRYIVPKSNPPVKDTIQCLNWALRQGLVLFNESERNVYMSLSAVKADKYGEIDKAMDYKDSSTVRSHETDTARYAVFHYFKHIYPGNRGGYFIV